MAQLTEEEQRWEAQHGPGETLAEHRARLHDPRNLEHEPCCPECCDCADISDDEDAS
jgi:hypothetical protein